MPATEETVPAPANIASAASQGETPQQSCPFHTLPSEVLLEIISAVPFSPNNFLSLRLTCRRFHAVLTQHEGPIAKLTACRTYAPRTLQLFPCLEDTMNSIRTLSRLHTRVTTLEQVHVRWLKITSHSPDLEWLKGRFEGVHLAGLLLLYHLQDLPLRPRPTATQDDDESGPRLPICTGCQRLHFLRSLPATSLACLLFKLIASIKILRIYGPEPINEAWRKGDMASRSDVELVCEELILRNGPWFFLALLQPDVDPGLTGQALGRLKAELESLPHHQHHFHPPTLISVVRRALAEKCAVDVRFAVSKMWELLASTGFDDLLGESEVTERLVKVVRGEELTQGEKGMRRIF